MANHILEMIVKLIATWDLLTYAKGIVPLVQTACASQTSLDALIQRFHEEQEPYEKIKLEAQIADEEESWMKLWLMFVSGVFFLLMHLFTSVNLLFAASPEKWKAAAYWLAVHATYIGWTVIKEALLSIERTWNETILLLFFIIVVSFYLYDNWEGRTDTEKSTEKSFFEPQKLEMAVKIIAILDRVISSFLVCVLILLERICSCSSVSEPATWGFGFTKIIMVAKIRISSHLLDLSSERLCRADKMTRVIEWIAIHLGYVVWTICNYGEAAILMIEKWNFSSLVVFDIIGILVAMVYCGKKCVECYNNNDAE